jgi:hypothetical protein
MKLSEKVRVGSKLRRRYDKPLTPLERLLACPQADPAKLQELKKLSEGTDPFALAKTIEQKLERIYRLANHRVSPSLEPPQPSLRPLTRAEARPCWRSLSCWASTCVVKPKKLTSAGYILNEATNHRRVTFLNELLGTIAVERQERSSRIPQIAACLPHSFKSFAPIHSASVLETFS